MVESAPTDICGLDPNTANITVPATNAYRPVTGVIPARRAVANCSGTAIAANVSAAARSGISHDDRYPRNDGNNTNPAPNLRSLSGSVGCIRS